MYIVQYTMYIIQCLYYYDIPVYSGAESTLKAGGGVYFSLATFYPPDFL